MRFSLSVLALVAACASERPGTGGTVMDSAEPVVAPASCGPALTWDTWAEGYFISWCMGCHHEALTGDERRGAPPGVDFQTLEATLAHVDRIRTRMGTVPPTMPPVGGGSEEERQRLVDWIDCGAL